MVKKAYSVETKLACIEMKKAGKSNKVIMETLGIKNVSQVKTWWRWYQNDELHRFYFYNETRIQQRLNDQSPVDYRNLVA